jgi:hypothetical protein
MRRSGSKAGSLASAALAAACCVVTGFAGQDPAGPAASRIVGGVPSARGADAADVLPSPILFVTQFPIPADFATIGSVFANHLGDIESVGRGGDLYIRYPDGSLRNLTAEAGYGSTGAGGFQDENAIAVRDPAVSWDGTRALFSMVIGAPAEQYQQGTWYWQIYQVTGLGEGGTAVITRLPGQPADSNNVSPAWLADGSVLYVGDAARNGARHLYPQLDEYEESPTPTGLWRLDPAGGAPQLVEPAVSGSFDPFVDSFGRIVFTRWDHLQRDQQADDPGNAFGTFNYASEAADAARLDTSVEVFPEPRIALAGSDVEGFTINHFFPWTVAQDGTGEEVLNHIGRHELHSYFDRSFNDDPSLHEFIAAGSGRTNPNPILNMLEISEDPTHPGRYLGIDAPEFYTHASGQVIALDAPPGANAADIVVDYLTPRSTAGFVGEGDPVPPDATGHYRNPVVLSDGSLIVAHTDEAHGAENDGTREQPVSNYRFRLKRLALDGNGYYAPVQTLTGGIVKTISYWDPDVEVSYSGELWELSPVEVRARPLPPMTGFALAAPEQQAFADENVDAEAFRAWLRANGLAVLVMRNVTSRDAADHQQPFNLHVPGGVTTTGDDGHVYDIAHMQFLEADQLRGLGGIDDPRPGRRMLAEPLNDAPAVVANVADPDGPAGSVPIFTDGSVAAYVPATRPMAWQSTAPDGTPVVRERYWISARPGEIRACDGCHGVNRLNQAGDPPAQNVPAALRALLARWRGGETELIFAQSFEPR